MLGFGLSLSRSLAINIGVSVSVFSVSVSVVSIAIGDEVRNDGGGVGGVKGDDFAVRVVHKLGGAI